MAAKHTQGQWRVDTCTPDQNQYITIHAPLVGVKTGKNTAVAVCGHPKQAEAQCNARLIAAAPELLAVLEEALRQSGCDGDLSAYAWHEKARAAIAKATGN